jgi:RNA polymerase sigma-70 factor, ECF subfamily
MTAVGTELEVAGSDKMRAFNEEALVHLDALFGVALRLTKNEKDAEDLVQDTLLKAFTHFAKYQRGTNCKAWLFKIQTNTFINRYRKKSREKVFLVDDRDHRPLQDRAVAPKRNILLDGAENEADWYQKIFSDDVKVALEEIPTDFRMVVLLADLYDFSYKETAEIVGCPIGTVMSRLYRGRRLLAAKLVDHALTSGYIKDDPRVDIEDENGEIQKVVEFKRRRRKRSG